MQTIEAIEQRRAVKTYDPGHKMTEAEIEQLLSAAILSPSAFNRLTAKAPVVFTNGTSGGLKRPNMGQTFTFIVLDFIHNHVKHRSDLWCVDITSKTGFCRMSNNIQNWRFVVVTDQAQKDKLKEAAWNQAQVSDASIVIVVCADLKAWDKEPARYWKNAAKETQEILVPMITQFYQGKDQLQRDEAMRSTGIVAQTIMLRAKDMGYDSCPMIGFDPVKVAEIINLPEDHVIGMLLPVGKSIKPAHPRGGQLGLADIVSRGHFLINFISKKSPVIKPGFSLI
jgi:nitroreductase